MFSALGVLLDPAWLLNIQVTALARSVYYPFRLIHQVHLFLGKKDLAVSTYVIVTSSLDDIHDMRLALKTIHRIQPVQNAVLYPDMDKSLGYLKEHFGHYVPAWPLRTSEGGLLWVPSPAA